eukprot:scaffold120091_cov19-Prasinocladus_malaysianus.AAC.1
MVATWCRLDGQEPPIFRGGPGGGAAAFVSDGGVWRGGPGSGARQGCRGPRLWGHPPPGTPRNLQAR